MQETLKNLTLPKIVPATEEEILAYLRYSCQFAEIAASAERDKLILTACEQLGITVSDEELQAAGDAFRHQHQMLSISETLAWLAQQRITVEDWSQGVRLSLLRQKLKENLFGEAVDTDYINNRDNYKRVALSQILVKNLTQAEQIFQILREDKASFCALALEHSKGKQSREQGGFVGICFLAELLPEIAEAVINGKEGEVISPIQTKLGYHILKIEKWFSPNMNEIREQILETLFQIWLQAGNSSSPLSLLSKP